MAVLALKPCDFPVSHYMKDKRAPRSLPYVPHLSTQALNVLALTMLLEIFCHNTHIDSDMPEEFLPIAHLLNHESSTFFGVPAAVALQADAVPYGYYDTFCLSLASSGEKLVHF
jgi:hypothetical protein